MKENDRIIKSNLKTLLKRYSRTDVITNLERSYTREALREIDPNLIENPYFFKNIKFSEEQISSFASDIKDGSPQPLIIRQKGNGFEVILGLRQLLGMKRLKLPTVDCIVNNFTDEEMLLVAASYLRDSNPIRVVAEADICKELKEKFNYKNKDLGLLFKQSEPQISNILKLLNLDQKILDLINREVISYGHAKSFARLEKNDVDEIVKEILLKGLSVRESERLVQSVLNKTKLNDNLIVTKNKITLVFTNEKDKQEALKRLNKLIKKKKIKL